MGCTSRRDKKSRELGIGLFRIPANKIQRAAWIKAISRKKWEPHSWDRVCSKHFLSGRSSDCREDVDYRPTLLMKGIEGRPDNVLPETSRCQRAQKRKADASMRETVAVRTFYVFT